MIATVALGLAALVVLALVVGLIDAVSAAQWRSVARDRRSVWEQRRRNERVALAREQHPDR